MEGNMGMKCFGVQWTAIENKVEDGIGYFDWNHYLDSLSVVVAENKVDEGMEGNMGMECYALQVVHWMVEDNMVDIGDRMGGFIVSNLR